MNRIGSSTNANAYNACTKLLYEIGLESNIQNPYAIPYANYVMLWADHIPINTIIIGQNPYPQNIYPEYGAAFAYSDTKSQWPPKTVQVISQDLYNFDGTDKTLSTTCFKDSWRLLEAGVILINETVFDKLLGTKRNTRSIKEMEAQDKALQVIISESFLAGQQSITCVGMGIPAASMTSIIRSWYPKDLFKMRVLTCRNPAARDIGDMSSHEVTIGKPAVSKLLSKIVKQFSDMPPPKVSQAERRKQQNIDSLKKASENISVTADAYDTELQSFKQRLEAARVGTDAHSTIEDVINTIDPLRRTINNHRNAIASHGITLVMLVESISKTQTDTSNIKSASADVHTSSTTIPVQSGVSQQLKGPRRRVNRSATPTVESIEVVPETPEPSEIKSEWNPSTPAPQSRARRRPARASSYAPSNAGTEYTTTSVVVPLAGSDQKDMSVPESVTMRCFANWCLDNIKNDVTYSSILNSASDDRIIVNSLSKELIAYIRERKETDPEYDAYNELADPDSSSTTWIKEFTGFEA